MLSCNEKLTCVLIDSGLIIDLTRHNLLFALPQFAATFPMLAIPCIIEGKIWI